MSIETAGRMLVLVAMRAAVIDAADRSFWSPVAAAGPQFLRPARTSNAEFRV